MTVGIIGFVGNVLIVCFLKAKKSTNSVLKTLSFAKNYDVYIKSLAISDILCAVISIPPWCIGLFYDVFEVGWSCRIALYLQIVFPAITMNNLLVISIEKYFSTRKVPRPFQHSTVKKLVFFAWFVGAIAVLFPTATYKGIRYDLNETHYTMICNYDKHYSPFRIVFLSFTLFQNIIPIFIITVISICLVTTVRAMTKRAVNIQQDNAIKAMARDAQRKGTITIVVLMLAFVIPYLYFFAQAFYNVASKKDIDFETDYIFRLHFSMFAYLNITVNVVIYLVQMKDFRAFLEKQLTSRFCDGSPNQVQPNNGQIQ